MTTKVKQQGTGNNDSLEDVLMAIGNLKTEDGKLLGIIDAIKEVKKVLEEREKQYDR